jgi:large subunit ribosomal protein L22
MIIKATQKNTRQSPRKVRLVANTIKNLSLEEAFRQLAVIPRKATEVVSKVMRQAVANAVNNHGYQATDLVIDSVIVNEGTRYKRFRAVSRGRAHNVVKRSSHVTVVLKTKE